MVPKREESPLPRLLATLVLGFFMDVLGATLFTWWSLGPVKLMPLVVMVVSAGFRLPLWAAGVAAVLLGYLSDLLSGGVVGLQLTACVLVVCLCALAQRKLEINAWPLQMLAVAVMSLGMHLTVIGGLMLTAREHLLPANLPLVLAAQAVLSALTAPVFFALLEALVRLMRGLGGLAGRVGS